MRNHIIAALLMLLPTHQLLAQNTSVKKMDINLENYDYPYPVKFLDLDIQGEKLKMAYMDIWPEKSNGKTIVLLHGKNFNGAYWARTATELSKNGYRVIVPDQIGFGKSSKPKHIQYSLQLLAKNTKQLLDAASVKKAFVLGHSMGGMLATRFALMYPDMVEKLILEDPIGLEDWKVKVPYTSVDEQYKTEQKQTYESLKDYQVKNYYHGEWKPEYETWLNINAGWVLNSDYNTIAWNSALTSDMIMTQPVCYEFENLKVPTLLIIGTKDKTALGKNLVSAEVAATMGDYPKLARETASKIKNSKLVEIDGVGHLPHIEAYNKFITEVLEYLKK